MKIICKTIIKDADEVTETSKVLKYMMEDLDGESGLLPIDARYFKQFTSKLVPFATIEYLINLEEFKRSNAKYIDTVPQAKRLLEFNQSVQV